MEKDKRLGLIEQDLRALSSKVDKYFILGLFGLIGLGAAGYSFYDKVFMMNIEMNEKLIQIIEKLP